MSNGLSREQICNMALDTAHIRAVITDLDNDNSVQAEVCRRWYTPTVNHLLETVYWPHAAATAELTVVAERDFDQTWAAGDPPPRWRFTYSVPTALIRPRFLSTYALFEFGYHTVGGGGRAIYTNQEDAVLIYTKKDTTVTNWTLNFVHAVVLTLASRLCGPLKGSQNHTQFLVEQARLFVAEQNASVANMSEESYDWTPDFLVARGYTDPRQSRFIYPVETFTVLPGAFTLNTN